MKIILHIGQSKTGTTALQSALRQNRIILKQHGILYPDFFLNGMALNTLNHNSFANALNGHMFHPRLSAEEYWDQFMKQMKDGGCKTLVLSAESFFGGAPYVWDVSNQEEFYDAYTAKLKKLKSFVANSEIQVIAYLRPQNLWLESAIPHLIRYEGTIGHRVYFDDDQAAELLEPNMNYHKFITFWDTILQPQVIKLKEYDRKTFPENNVVFDFMDHIDIKDKNFVTQAPKEDGNESWSREFVEFKKQLNLSSKSKAQERTTIEIINALEQEMGSREKYRISPELHSIVQKRFEEGNARLSEQYNNGQNIFSEYTVTQDIPAPSDIVEYAQVKQKFEKIYKSPYGRKTLILHIIKGRLRAFSPFLYSILSRKWKKYKTVST